MNARTINSVLLIEDNPGDARLILELFKEHGSRHIQLIHVTSIDQAHEHLARSSIDVVLLDLDLPDAHGLQAVQCVRAAARHVPLVVLTGRDDESLAIQALQEGAQDYLVKGQIESRGFLRALRYAMERKSMEDALFAEKERAQVTLSSIGDAVVCTDIDGNITFLNVVAEKMTGWVLNEVVGLPVANVIQLLGTRPAQAQSSRLLVHRDGSQIPIEDSFAAIHNRDGRPTGTVIVLRDASAARAMSLQMAHSAEHDTLTGLPNRMLLNDRITQSISLARRHANHVAVLFLDLDDFKHINDSLGHPIGDKLLQSVSARLVACARGSDTVSRQGGDEFVVLLPEVEHVEDAAITAKRILSALAQPHSIDRQDLHISASIGVSIFPSDGTDAETLIKSADTAMYQAKESGRQNFKFFKPEMNARAVERQSIEESLRRALERNEFLLHYQPKVDFRTGAIVGAEALIRWRHPKRGLVSPAQFIPIAEESGLIVPIGKWVLREACDQARSWAAMGLPEMTMAVNVSAVEFHAEHFLASVFEALNNTGLAPRLLEIELTESVLMKYAESAASILKTLREAGVQIAIDDFGTGYSSLSYLRKFPVDSLKIDQSFVSQITAFEDDASIVTSVINMAHGLRLRVVAEGVETLEQLNFLRAHNCDEAQGFYFSRPVPPLDFAVLLKVPGHRCSGRSHMLGNARREDHT